MTELSPIEHELAEHRLVLFPNGEPDERLLLLPSAVATRPELQIQVLLRDVRDKSQPTAARHAWLARAWELGAPMSRFGWFTLHLALLRHAVLLGEVQQARTLASELVDQFHERPSADITDQDSLLRDALRRAQRALRVPILARTIKLDIGDPLPRIIETAKTDRSLDDRSRIGVLLRILGGVRRLGADDTPIVELLAASGSSPDQHFKDHDAWFKREAARTYLARPIYEFDRIPEELRWRRANAGIVATKEYW